MLLFLPDYAEHKNKRPAYHLYSQTHVMPHQDHLQVGSPFSVNRYQKERLVNSNTVNHILMPSAEFT